MRKHEHLKDYTIDELFEAIEDNESIAGVELAFYCSEILKRQRCKTDTHSQDQALAICD